MLFSHFYGRWGVDNKPSRWSKVLKLQTPQTPLRRARPWQKKPQTKQINIKSKLATDSLQVGQEYLEHQLELLNKYIENHEFSRI